MKNLEQSTSNKALRNDSTNRLMTASQASSYLRSLVTDSFSTSGPKGYEYKSQPLFTPEILLNWLRVSAAKMENALENELLTARLNQKTRSQENSEDDEDEDDDDDDDDDDEGDDD